jgi:parallel beta-helix repeat protein
MRIAIIPCLLLAAAGAATSPAGAAESYDGCTGTLTALPAQISTPGVWCLKKDLATPLATGHVVEIKTSNVTIDCNGFKLGNLQAGAGTDTIGIGATGVQNVAIRRCTLRGFAWAIFVNGGAGHLVEDNRMDGNTHYGVFVGGSGSGGTVRRNTVVDTGSSTWAADTMAIRAEGEWDVLDNTVSGVYPYGMWGAGIYTVTTGSVTGNRIRGVTSPIGTAPLALVLANASTIATDNDVQGLADTGDHGIYCYQPATIVRNVITAFTMPTTGCVGSETTIVAD